MTASGFHCNVEIDQSRHQILQRQTVSGQSIKERPFAVVSHWVQTSSQDLSSVVPPPRTYRYQLCLEEWVVDVIGRQECDGEGDKDVLVDIIERVGRVAAEEVKVLGDIVKEILGEHLELCWRLGGERESNQRGLDTDLRDLDVWMLLLGIHEADEPRHEEAKVADRLPDEGWVEKLGIVCVDGGVQGSDVGFELGDGRLPLSLKSRILN